MDDFLIFRNRLIACDFVQLCMKRKLADRCICLFPTRYGNPEYRKVSFRFICEAYHPLHSSPQ